MADASARERLKNLSAKNSRAVFPSTAIRVASSLFAIKEAVFEIRGVRIKPAAIIVNSDLLRTLIWGETR
jgi:hypothetical protein